MKIEIETHERKRAEELAQKFLIPMYDDLTDEGKLVFIVTLMRDRGGEIKRINTKFKP